MFEQETQGGSDASLSRHSVPSKGVGIVLDPHPLIRICLNLLGNLSELLDLSEPFAKVAPALRGPLPVVASASPAAQVTKDLLIGLRPPEFGSFMNRRSHC